MSPSTISEAFDLARHVLFVGGPGVHTSDPDSVYYVETTFGDARDVLPVSPDGFTGFPEDPEIAADDAVWVIVAYGSFAETRVPGELVTPDIYTTAWGVFVVGTPRYATGVGRDEFDLDPLGDVNEVDVPLPPNPTPIDFGTPSSSETSVTPQ